MQVLDESIARKVLETVDAGLVWGLGSAKPGQMCVEAAVCFAYGLPHSDNPPCVGSAVRSFKIRLNDARWSSNAARTQGMRALAIAQLGSDAIDQRAFADMVAEGTIRRVVPLALRKAAEKAREPHKAAMLAAALRCENEGTRGAALEARRAADADAYADAAADAAAYAAAAAYAYADAAAAAVAYAYAAADAYADEILTVSADVALQALLALDSPGCQYLYLLTEAA